MNSRNWILGVTTAFAILASSLLTAQADDYNGTLKGGGTIKLVLVQTKDGIDIGPGGTVEFNGARYGISRGLRVLNVIHGFGKGRFALDRLPVKDKSSIIPNGGGDFVFGASLDDPAGMPDIIRGWILLGANDGKREAQKVRFTATRSP